jgi:hypothetical protein
VDGVDSLHALDFDDDPVLNHKIHSVPKFDLFAVINHRQTDLAEHVQAPVTKFMRQATLIGTL